MSLYPQTALEVVYVLQLERAGYLKVVPLEVHPEYPDMAVRIGATSRIKAATTPTTARWSMKHPPLPSDRS
ncbi:hypothetical protein ANRL2_02235 [Anaerolineae bacterium]|nr:hypothetical protein ANRL2_02235 [Anaerolineae bacterium]